MKYSALVTLRTYHLTLAWLCWLAIPINAFAQSDTIQKSRKFQVKKYFTYGSISVEYNYGAIPFALTEKNPMGMFRTQGQFGIQIKKIPLQASFFYTDLKNITGLNNYFRISFDANKYKQQVYDQLARKDYALKKQKEALQNLRQNGIRHLYYLSNLQEELALPDSLAAQNLDKFKKPKINLPSDSVNLPSIDSSSLSLPDSINIPNVNTPVTASLPAIDTAFIHHLRDSIDHKIESQKTLIKEHEEKIKKLDEEIKALTNPEAYLQKYVYPKNPLASWLGAIKKFDVGMSYPNWSTFMVSNIPLKGINMEVQRNDFYFAFAHGKTLSNLYFSNTVLQNNLLNTRNLFNFFDFNSVTAGRRITSFKTGYGKKEGNHIYAGLMYGKGYNMYSDSVELNTSSELERNYVAEIDGKLLLGKNHAAEVIFGRASLQSANAEIPDNEKGFAGLLNSSERSYSLMGKYTGTLFKGKTKITATGRWIDPFFRSFGVGFIRPDNLRYELRADQAISSKIKLTGFIRKERDNLLSLFSYTNYLYSAGFQLTGKLSRHITIRGSFNPVFQQTLTGEDSTNIFTENYITNGVITWNRNGKKATHLMSAYYNFYKVNTTVSQILFHNAGYTYQLDHKKGISNIFNASIFYSPVSDSIQGTTILLANELQGKIGKKLILSGGLKYAQGKTITEDIGFTFKGEFIVNKNISVQSGFEKLVRGDYYNSINYFSGNQNLFYSWCKLSLSW